MGFTLGIQKKKTGKLKTGMGFCDRPGLHLCQWGRCGWTMLHAWAHTYPIDPTDEDKASMRGLLVAFAEHIPCRTCRQHFTRYVAEHLSEADLATRDTLVRFANDAHNAVNRRLGRRVWTLEEHYAAYAPPSTSRSASWLVGALALLAVGVFLWRRIRWPSCQGPCLEHCTRPNSSARGRPSGTLDERFGKGGTSTP